MNHSRHHPHGSNLAFCLEETPVLPSWCHDSSDRRGVVVSAVARGPCYLGWDSHERCELLIFGRSLPAKTTTTMPFTSGGDVLEQSIRHVADDPLRLVRHALFRMEAALRAAQYDQAKPHQGHSSPSRSCCRSATSALVASRERIPLAGSAEIELRH